MKRKFVTLATAALWVCAHAARAGEPLLPLQQTASLAQEATTADPETAHRLLSQAMDGAPLVTAIPVAGETQKTNSKARPANYRAVTFRSYPSERDVKDAIGAGLYAGVGGAVALYHPVVASVFFGAVAVLGVLGMLLAPHRAYGQRLNTFLGAGALAAVGAGLALATPPIGAITMLVLGAGCLIAVGASSVNDEPAERHDVGG
jgi:hypothetical protein